MRPNYLHDTCNGSARSVAVIWYRHYGLPFWRVLFPGHSGLNAVVDDFGDLVEIYQ